MHYLLAPEQQAWFWKRVYRLFGHCIAIQSIVHQPTVPKTNAENWGDLIALCIHLEILTVFYAFCTSAADLISTTALFAPGLHHY